MIIAVDGADCSGKSTALDLLYDKLTIDRGMSTDRVKRVRHPGSTRAGQELRKVVKMPGLTIAPTAERLIFAADSVQFEAEFATFSAEGGIVLCDRFNRITDFVYGQASGMQADWLIKLQDLVGLNLMADYYFVFQLPVEEILARQALRRKDTRQEHCRIEDNGDEFMRHVNDQYNSLKIKTGSFPSQYPHGEYIGEKPKFNHLQAIADSRAHNIIPVNATKMPQEICGQMLEHLSKVLGCRKST
ncbi:MAG: hypothetical protein GZ088_09555 [Acidipila sp.]|nr:hypothetical protein [Acidipila sp.]